MGYTGRSGMGEKERVCLSRLRQMLNEGRFMSGNLVRREHTCGKKYCRCMKGEKYRHSSWYIGRSVKGKMYMKYIPYEQLEEVKVWTKRYQLARKLLRKIGDVMWQRIGKR